METLVCPLCQKVGLVELPRFTSVLQKRVVCENEYYKHVRFGDHHFLIHMQEEDDSELRPENIRESLVLN